MAHNAERCDSADGISHGLSCSLNDFCRNEKDTHVLQIRIISILSNVNYYAASVVSARQFDRLQLRRKTNNESPKKMLSTSIEIGHPTNQWQYYCYYHHLTASSTLYIYTYFKHSIDNSQGLAKSNRAQRIFVKIASSSACVYSIRI